MAISPFELRATFSETVPSPYIGWRRFCVAGAIALALVSLVQYPTLSDLVRTWATDSTYSHGFLILPIAIYLAWIRRWRLSEINPEPTFYSVPMMMLVSLALLAGWAGNVRILQQLAFVASLVVVLVGVWGFRAFRVFAFPALYLFFQVPFGDSLVQPLRDATARFAVFGLELLQIPVLLDNHAIIVSSGTWEVADTCSGLRFLIAALALGISLWGVLRFWKHRIGLLVVAVLISTVGNGLRVLGIILLGYATNNRIAAGFDHVIYGWIFVSLLLASLVLLAIHWGTKERESGKYPPEPNVSPRIQYPIYRGMRVLAVLLLVVASVPLLKATAQKHGALNTRIAVASPWVPTTMISSGWWPRQPNTMETFDRRFFDGKTFVDVHVAYASVYSGGIVPVSTWNLTDDSLWSGESIRRRKGTVNRLPTEITESAITLSGRNRRVWTFYFADGQYTSSDVRLKYLQAMARLTSRNPVSAMISISTESDDAPAVLSAWLASSQFATVTSNPSGAIRE